MRTASAASALFFYHIRHKTLRSAENMEKSFLRLSESDFRQTSTFHVCERACAIKSPRKAFYHTHEKIFVTFNTHVRLHNLVINQNEREKCEQNLLLKGRKKAFFTLLNLQLVIIYETFNTRLIICARELLFLFVIFCEFVIVALARDILKVETIIHKKRTIFFSAIIKFSRLFFHNNDIMNADFLLFFSI